MITQKLISVRSNTRPGWKQASIKGLVVHYTANNGGTALNHYNYFNNGANGVYASAHYFIDKTSIIQLVPDMEVAFHANETGYSKVAAFRGASSNGYVGHANCCTIGLEMCLEKDGSIHPETIKKTQWLIGHLQAKYKVPDNLVVRHYDITGKLCPKHFIDETKWIIFKSKKGQAPQTNTQSTLPLGRTHIGVAKVKVDYINLRDKDVDGKVLRQLPKGTSWKVYRILPNGWLDLGGGFASNVGNTYFNVDILW